MITFCNIILTFPFITKIEETFFFWARAKNFEFLNNVEEINFFLKVDYPWISSRYYHDRLEFLYFVTLNLEFQLLYSNPFEFSIVILDRKITKLFWWKSPLHSLARSSLWIFRFLKIYDFESQFKPRVVKTFTSQILLFIANYPNRKTKMGGRSNKITISLVRFQ